MAFPQLSSSSSTISTCSFPPSLDWNLLWVSVSVFCFCVCVCSLKHCTAPANLWIVLSIFTVSLFSGAVKRGLLSIALQLSPLFWVAFALRIKCLTDFLEGQLCRQFFASNGAGKDGEGGEDGEEEDDYDSYDTDQEEQCACAQVWSALKRVVSFNLKSKLNFKKLSRFFFCLPSFLQIPLFYARSYPPSVL